MKTACRRRTISSHAVFFCYILTTGIGVDDLFVLLAAWRATSYNLPTDDRMSESYSDAAVSVTVTSLTNILAFGIGAITTFPSVQIFCLYTGAGVLFAFLYMVTIQGAFLYYTGLAEEKNRHSVTCMPATYHEDAGSKLSFAMFKSSLSVHTVLVKLS